MKQTRNPSPSLKVNPELSKYVYSGKPGGLSGQKKLAKHIQLPTSSNDLKALYSEDATLRRFYNVPRVTKRQIHEVKAYVPGTVYQMDTFDLSYESSKKYPFATIYVDCYSRFCDVQPIKNRGFDEMKTATENFWKTVGPFEKWPCQKRHQYLSDAGLLTQSDYYFLPNTYCFLRN